MHEAEQPKTKSSSTRVGVERFILLGAGAAIGVIGGFGAIGFRILIDLIQQVFYHSNAAPLDLFSQLPLWERVVGPAAGGLIVGPLVYFLAREAKGHGVPEVMEAVALRGGLIRRRVMAVKAIASAISIGGGGSVGREGPIVQIGSAMGSFLGQLARVSHRTMRTLVACGTAAGIAATFNAPLAGALFAIEILLAEFRFSDIVPVVVSSVVATMISHHFLGDMPAFLVPQYELVSAIELGPYLILGVIAALVGTSFTKSVYAMEDLFDRVRIPPYTKAAVGGGLVGVIGIFYPQIFGVGYGAITLALQGQLVWQILLALILVKILATSLTLGAGMSGGVFAPSLFIGAMLGGSLGSLFHAVWPEWTASSGAYALVGMAAVVAATTHAPVTAILIIFEMTSDYKIILPVMIASVVATFLATAISKESIYTLKLARRGLSLRAGREVNVLRSIPVRRVMTDDMLLIPHDAKISAAVDLIVHSHYSYCPVVADGNELVGLISLQDVREILFGGKAQISDETVAMHIAQTHLVTCTLDDNLDEVFKKLGSRNIDEIPVVAPHDGNRLLGMVRRKDAIAAYNNELIKQGILD